MNNSSQFIIRYLRVAIVGGTVIASGFAPNQMLQADVRLQAIAPVIYPGLACQPATPVDALATYHLTSGTFNFGTPANAGVGLNCPITRVRLESRAGVQVLIYVRRTGPDLTTFVRCSLLVFARDGVGFVSGADAETSGTNLNQTLNLVTHTSTPHGHYAIDCFVMRDWGISKYEVRELAD